MENLLTAALSYGLSLLQLLSCAGLQEHFAYATHDYLSHVLGHDQPTGPALVDLLRPPPPLPASRFPL